MTMRELVLDTETTGLDPRDNHRIIELACVELVNYIPTGSHWHWYFNPERTIPSDATDVHGLTIEFLSDKPVFAHCAEEIWSVIGDARLVIHNAAFDIAFLNHEFGRLNRPAIDFGRVFDTLALARRKHPGSPNNLDALCKRYSVDSAKRTKHGALLDSELLADVYIRLLGVEQGGLNFALVEENGAGYRAVSLPAARRPAPLPPRLTQAEIAAHASFVATLGEVPLWKTYNGAHGAQVSRAA